VERIIQQLQERIPSEPYPELRLVLERFVAGVQNALKGKFLGAYLVGSLATGDFDLDSHIDFLILTEEELTEPEVPILKEAHVAIHGLGSYRGSASGRLLYKQKFADAE